MSDISGKEFLERRLKPLNTLEGERDADARKFVFKDRVFA